MNKKPQRMCICCREMQDKTSLTRMVKTDDGLLQIDHTGKKNGRGAYICKSDICKRKLLKSSILNKVLGVNMTKEQIAVLLEEI